MRPNLQTSFAYPPLTDPDPLRFSTKNGLARAVMHFIYDKLCYNMGMVDQLFGSKTRVKLLQLFMANPNRSFYVREITRKVEEQINSVRRELSNLLSIGVITSDNSNNKLYYEVNQKYEYYEPLAVIFGDGVISAKKIKKDAVDGKKEIIVNQEIEVAKLGNVSLAFLTGWFTRDDSAPIDFFIVGDVNRTKVDNYMKELETAEKREIRYVIFSENEFMYRRQINDRFTVTALEAKKQILIDKEPVF